MERFSSYHCVNGRDRDFDSRGVPAHCLEVGEQIGYLLEAAGIPAQDCAWAFATCRIQVMGKDAHNDLGQAKRRGQGGWVHTRMMIHTAHKLPGAEFQRRENGRFVWADSFAGANRILDCFGLDLTGMLDHFGSNDNHSITDNVKEDERKVFDLTTIIEEMASEILFTARQRIAQSA